MADSSKFFRVCRSTRRIAECCYPPTHIDYRRRGIHVEVYEVRFWERSSGIDYEFQKVADMYPTTVCEMENLIRCFGIVWENVESVSNAVDILTDDFALSRACDSVSCYDYDD